jgi:hypothetical protein
MTTKLTIHAGKGKYVVNAPGSGLPPRVYTHPLRAFARVLTLLTRPAKT